VWGVVYDVTDLDVEVLDSFEDYKPGRRTNSYVRRECLILRDGDAQRPMVVSSYFGVADVSPPLPNAEYKQLIVSGARHWRLPGRMSASSRPLTCANDDGDPSAHRPHPRERRKPVPTRMSMERAIEGCRRCSAALHGIEAPRRIAAPCGLAHCHNETSEQHQSGAVDAAP
jgi:hypothetical protein